MGLMYDVKLGFADNLKACRDISSLVSPGRRIHTKFRVIVHQTC